MDTFDRRIDLDAITRVFGNDATKMKNFNAVNLRLNGNTFCQLFANGKAIINGGPTMSGKSTFTLQLLKNVSQSFTPVPTRIVYAYGDTTLLILDDLMEEIASATKASALFTRDVHHKNVSVVFISQNLFKQGKNMRDISLNSQYMVVFKSVRDTQQIKTLAHQLGMPHLPEAYKKAIKEPFGYLLINLRPETPDKARLQSNIFGYRRIYVEK
ncbi:uncharacterized protein LOC129590691 isoform X2 [Paramacrobiotus metropolitanus]|uniref:uncharacterized protein LOC129590691 isoform X2 n=1 Tax=Paramacrobiotus metropolitanus TaxID=2943436 RepID=UPI002445EFEB|nr:uncharacterized protein LOC129590691 isoform X2 [Paramacrobiotus metropolitanus]